MAHIAERTATRALIAHNHERSRTLAEALANIRTGRLFAYRMQLMLAQYLLDIVKTRTRRGSLHPYPIGFFKALGLNHLNRNTPGLEIGRASCRERVVQYVEISVIAGTY